MTTITPAEAQEHIDYAAALHTAAEIHTMWGDAAWNAGDTGSAIRHWLTAAHYSVAAKREER